MLGSRAIALAAKLLAEELLQLYCDKVVPDMVSHFSAAGITRQGIINSHASLYRVLIMAAYDRRPFTGAGGGYEMIWGSNRANDSLARRFESLGLLDFAKVQGIDEEDVERILQNQSYFGLPLDSAGSVRYALTFRTAASMTPVLHRKLLSVKSAEDIRDVYGELTKVNGIGEVIGSKVLKYTLREMAVASVNPVPFPLDVVWPIMGEYHNEQAAQRLRTRLGHDIVPLTMGLLLQAGDPFAIDGLFYLDRNDKKRLEAFIDDVSQWNTGTRRAPVQQLHAAPVRSADLQSKAKKMMTIVKEVCDDINGVAEKDLGGLTTISSLRKSAARLLVNMQPYAETNSVDEMYRYYVNCLDNPEGQRLDWILSKIGRKSLKSEFSRFEAVYRE